MHTVKADEKLAILAFNNSTLRNTFFNYIFTVAVSKRVTLSSTTKPGSYAVDNIIHCNYRFLAHSRLEFQPWLKIDLQAMYDVIKVIIFNRYDCCGILLKLSLGKFSGF